MKVYFLVLLATLLATGCKSTKVNPHVLNKQEVRDVAIVRETTQERVDSTLKPKLASVDSKVSGIQKEVQDVENAVKAVEKSAQAAIEKGIAANSAESRELRSQTDQIMAESGMLRDQVSGLEVSMAELTDTITKLGQELVSAHEEIAKLNIRIAKEYELRAQESEGRIKAERALEKVKASRRTILFVAGGIILLLSGLIYMTNKRGIL